MTKKNKKVVKIRKIKKKPIIISITFLIITLLIIYGIMQIRITNIYIIDNEYLSDYEIIKLAKIDNYPNSIKNSSKTIKKRLEKNDYIKSVKVQKKGLLNEVYIYIEENVPLFFYQLKNKVVLKDGKEVKGSYNIPLVTNEISSEVYDEFIKKMGELDKDIIIRISEIKYDPNEIDNERFYLTMNDGNYVYLTLNKFEKINNYIEIIRSFNNDKGILYLDSGEYFELFSGKNE